MRPDIVKEINGLEKEIERFGWSSFRRGIYFVLTLEGIWLMVWLLVTD